METCHFRVLQQTLTSVCGSLQEYSLLYEEATFFQLAPLQVELERWRSTHERGSVFPECECVMVHVAPELGERISISAHRDVIEEVFPNVKDAMSSSVKVTWDQDSTHVHRFPLTGSCHLNSVQVYQTIWVTNLTLDYTSLCKRSQTEYLSIFHNLFSKHRSRSTKRLQIHYKQLQIALKW